MSRPILLLLVSCAPALTGCVPMMAASAASMAVQAAQYGEVHVIDVEQHRIDKIIVWGTVDDGKEKRSFQCDFGTKITGFKLREIRAQQ